LAAARAICTLLPSLRVRDTLENRASIRSLNKAEFLAARAVSRGDERGLAFPFAVLSNVAPPDVVIESLTDLTGRALTTFLAGLADL
jgi:hypothetical protein